MTNVLFVHGTAGRKPRILQAFTRIQEAIHSRRPDVRVKACFWGDTVGAALGGLGPRL